jgi:hypothetical protein
VNEDDKKEFLEDFKKADINQKLDMWFFALNQGGIWEELLAEMSEIATVEQMKQMKKKA